MTLILRFAVDAFLGSVSVTLYFFAFVAALRVAAVRPTVEAAAEADERGRAQRESGEDGGRLRGGGAAAHGGSSVGGGRSRSVQVGHDLSCFGTGTPPG